MKRIVAFIAVLVVITTIAYFGVRLDMIVNPWLKTAAQEWKWWNFFTSKHFLTVLFLIHPWVAIGIITFLSIIPTVVITRDRS